MRTPFGEIDLLLEDPASGAVVVVEVKARAGAAFGGGREAVTAAKQRRLGRAALHVVADRGLASRPVRFDVVTVERDASGRAAIEHIRDAFQIDGDALDS